MVETPGIHNLGDEIKLEMVFGNPRDMMLEKVIKVLGLSTSRERESVANDLLESIWQGDTIDGSLAPLGGIMDFIGFEGTVEETVPLDCELAAVKAAFIITVLVGTNWKKQTRKRSLSNALIEMLARGKAFVKRQADSEVGPRLVDIETLIIPRRH